MTTTPLGTVCNECHSTIQPNYKGACVTCLRRELAQARADRDVLAEEVRAYRYHIADKGGEFFEMMKTAVVTWDHWKKCEKATDTSQALTRAGGGA